MRNIRMLVCLGALFTWVAACSDAEKPKLAEPPPPVSVEEGCASANRACDPGDVRACTLDGRPGEAACSENCQWDDCAVPDDPDSDTGDTDDTETEEPFIPPEESCPEGTFEFNIPDIWSSKHPVHLEDAGRGVPYATSPNTLLLKEDHSGLKTYGARLHTDNCAYYRVCLPNSIATIYLEAVDPSTECGGAQGRSSAIDISEASAVAAAADGKVTMGYEGTAAQLTNDFYSGEYTGFQGKFTFEGGAPEVTGDADPLVWKAECNDLNDYITLHIRWPWSDPLISGFSGTACEDETFGIVTPSYPGALSVKFDQGCADMAAVLERNDDLCPWYRLLIPRSLWENNAISLSYTGGESAAYINPIPLPETDLTELWLVYDGPPDDDSSGSNCMNYSNRGNVFHFYNANLGPGYPGCGGKPVPTDACADIKPLGHSIIHFRYIWAGQKTFTYFPRDEFMPTWVMFEVNNVDTFCVQEGKSPWFRCPVPDTSFFEGATWRAVDRASAVKFDTAEWNTVCPRENFPAKPGTYWLRWTYGKPDICETSEFDFTNFYPDGAEYASNAAWGDFCFDKEQLDRPPIESDGFFPWNETYYKYDYGGSIAQYYDDPVGMQKLLNYFVWERYKRWKDKYVKWDDDACGAGTARVDSSDSVAPTVSEGQGYGMAISAAIGDKKTFTALWRFVRHFLSQHKKKYCGGLMGWAWKGPENCQPLDEPCDPDVPEANCGGDKDSAFDGDIDIAIGLMYAAWQWPEFTEDAVDWLVKMECEVNNRYDGVWYYPTPGDTWTKNCSRYPTAPCNYEPGVDGGNVVNMSYYGPGFFRVFGEFLMNKMSPAKYTIQERRNHLDFWYRTAETVWELTERCYGDTGTHPALYTDWGSYEQGCGAQSDNYNWSRALWRNAIDAAWYGPGSSFFSASPNSSRAYPNKSQIQAKMDLIQDYYAHEFPAANPPLENANRFSRICRDLNPSGTVTDCDPAYDHNSYFVNTAMCAFVPDYDNDKKTTVAIRKEALEEAVTVTIQNDKYYQESLGVYTMLFLSGNFPRPFSKMEVMIEIE